MYLLAGLGNPGTKYEHTRHNAGFMFVDFIHKLLSFPPYKTIHTSLVAKLVNPLIRNQEIIVVKPQSYMNTSGRELQKICQYYKVDIHNALIAHDDLDIPLGKFKIDHSVGPELHNGISSIESSFRTKDFHRVRIGVDNRIRETSIPGEKYVLERFSNDEESKLLATFPLIVSLLKLEYRSSFPFFS